MVKISPDHTFEKMARQAFHQNGGNHFSAVRCMWQMKGPPNTDIAWIECLLIGRGIALVETFKSGGWGVFTPCGSTDPAEVIADGLNRCRVEAPETAA